MNNSSTNNNIISSKSFSHRKHFVIKYNGLCPYVWKNFLNMNYSIILLIWISMFGTLLAETDYFPGLRRPPNNQISNEERSYLIEQLSNFIEEQARRRFQQQQRQFLYHQKNLHRPQEIIGNGYSYFMAPSNAIENEFNQKYEFGVNPSDPRYYEETPKEFLGERPNEETPNEEYFEETEHMKSFPNNNDENLEDVVNNNNNNIINNNNNNINNHNNNDIKIDSINKPDGEYFIPPMHVNPKVSENKGSREQEKENRKMLLHANRNNADKQKLNNDLMSKSSSGVFQKPLDIESAMGLYIVALIAGISAAFTVGLIAIGVFWFSLHKKAKLAADVDYPAYGVTGPNLNQYGKGSPNATVDKKLAQSAQMYHYQHQKQQIIAMENRPSGEMNGQRVGSDAESDEENEGDYTVYEYAGQGFTGEMEVKNPLFDPTPTSAANGTQNNQPKTPPTTTETTKQDSKPTSNKT